MIAKQHLIKSLSSLWSSSASLLAGEAWQGKDNDGEERTMKLQIRFNWEFSFEIRALQLTWWELWKCTFKRADYMHWRLGSWRLFHFRSHCTNAQRAVSALRKLICGLIQQKCPYIQIPVTHMLKFLLFLKLICRTLHFCKERLWQMLKWLQLEENKW